MKEVTNNEQVSLPVLIAKNLLVFPSVTESLEAGRDFSKGAIETARADTNSLLLVASQIDENKDKIENKDDLYPVCTICRILNYVAQDGVYRVRVSGSKRALIKEMAFDSSSGCYRASVEVIEETKFDALSSIEQEAVRGTLEEIVRIIQQSPVLARRLPKNALNSITNGTDSEQLADVLAAYLPLPMNDKADILASDNVKTRLELLLKSLKQQKELWDIDAKLDDTVRDRADKSQKEYFLREKMRAIKDELGEGKNLGDDEDAIREKLKNNPYPESVKKKVEKELARYEMMPESSLEASLIMNYIDVLMNVPWYQETIDDDDLSKVQAILDEDHYGLNKVKKRIIEYLAVKAKTGSLKAPILCFYGPPGCGKTSLAKSIARALGRKFVKASLGGVSDEAEIRGHRRTYVGSMPGRIIQGMTKAGVRNPVFLLDEIDKVGNANYRGDTASALLEVLDPEQNSFFNDNYLEEPYDLSHVLFIATANYLENVPAPLRDRLELIEVPSYTELEKIQIATGFLVKKQMRDNGVKEGEVEFRESGIKEIIEFYTREAGVRELERLVASCLRKAVVELLTHPETPKPIIVNDKKVRNWLGVEIFEDTKKEKEPQIGVVTGLAYTEFGGDILPIEVNYFPGKGGLILTGKLGDVMKESCTIALDYVRANAEKYGIDSSLFEKNDIHIHVPEGAVPKDGPSAGVAITTAIVSCLTKRHVDNNVAMTGEVTLRGNALPIGGLREKSLAALRSGIKTIIVPLANKKDVGELPEEVKKKLKIHYMKEVDDALKIALLA